MIARLDSIYNARDGNGVGCSRGKLRQRLLAGGKCEHGVIGSSAFQAVLDLHHQSSQMQADGLYRPPRTVAGMLYGPGIDAQSKNGHQFRIGIFPRK